MEGSRDPSDVEEGDNDSIVPLAVLMMMGIASTVVNRSLSNHNSFGKRCYEMYMTPGIIMVLGSSLGVSYLFYESVSAQFNASSASEVMSIIMKLPPIVYAMVFLAAVIPGIEIYLHPANH